MTACVYETSLDKPCGRETVFGYCDFHSVIVQLDAFDFRNPTPIVVPASVRPLIDRILSSLPDPIWSVCP